MKDGIQVDLKIEQSYQIHVNSFSIISQKCKYTVYMRREFNQKKRM